MPQRNTISQRDVRPLPALATILCLAAILSLAGLQPAIASEGDTGLVEDPSFSSFGQGRQSKWDFSQHAGPVSYEVSVADNVLTLKRTGVEPFGRVAQEMNIQAYQGKRLEFSAEVRGTFTRPGEPAEAHTGIGIQFKGFRPGAPRMLGPTILATEYAGPELPLDSSEWQTQSIQFDVPQQATLLYLTAILGRWGTLDVRNPRLAEVAE